MGRDESGTLAALKAFRREPVDPSIAAHRGRIVKTPAMGCCWTSQAWSMPCAVWSSCRQRWQRRALRYRKLGGSPSASASIGDIIIDGDDIFGESTSPHDCKR